MSSWNRGRDNEAQGDEKLDESGAVNKVQGAVQKVAGMAEQGIDNVVDRVTGKQEDLKGEVHNTGEEASDWVDSRGEDAAKMARDADTQIDRSADRAGDWAQERAEDVDRTTDQAADWVQERT